MSARLSRRIFVKATGVVVATFVLNPGFAFSQSAPILPRSLRTQRSLKGWIRIEANGTITVFTGKAELGQGILTALAQIAAEELDVPIATIQMVSADTTRGPNEGYTYGSQSIEQSGSAIRVAAAEARLRLVTLAASRLGVPAVDLQVREGVVIAADGRKASYWELAEGHADLLALDISGTATPKRALDYRLVGVSVPRIDLPTKVTGGVAFIQDLRLPGMLYGRVVRPRGYGAKLISVDDTKARALPSVVTVTRQGSFLGVVARREEQAIAARQALAKAAKWSEDSAPLPDVTALPAELKTWPAERSVVGQAGQEAPTALGGKKLQAAFSRPFLSHASLAPSCGVAWLRDDHMTVWSHTQGAFPLRGDIAKVLGMPTSKVDVIHTPSAGCYGHNGADDAALDAALLARAVPGQPVKVQWMRDDEFTLEPFGPAMTTHIQATLSTEGRITDWLYEVWSNTHAMRPGQPGGVNLLGAWQLDPPFTRSPPLHIPQPYGDGDRNAVPIYMLPRFQSINHLIMATPIRNSSLRTLGAHLNVFSIESFMDELALEANADPVTFRLAHLADPRTKAVIAAVVAKSGWSAHQRGDGHRGRGFAFSRYENIGAYAAVVADLEVDRNSGNIRITHVFVAVDVGQVVNPNGLRSQIEGGVVQAISWTLKEQVLFDRREITTRDWSSYPVVRFSEVPPIEVVLLDRPEQPFHGAGEASSAPTSAAIGNAFANATGRRLRNLPMSAEKVKAALAAPVISSTFAQPANHGTVIA